MVTFVTFSLKYLMLIQFNLIFVFHHLLLVIYLPAIYLFYLLIISDSFSFSIIITLVKSLHFKQIFGSNFEIYKLQQKLNLNLSTYYDYYGTVAI